MGSFREGQEEFAKEPEKGKLGRLVEGHEGSLRELKVPRILVRPMAMMYHTQ